VDTEKRFEDNPFLNGMTVKTKGKRITVGTFGDKDNVLVNQATGEQTATHVTAYKKVDAGSFVKLFAENIAFTFDLTSAGLKSLNLVIWVLQYQGIGKDLIIVDSFALRDFLDSQDSDINMSVSTMMKGILDLQKAKIIAKASRKGSYYINPNFIFNGDRIAFTTMIERKG